MALFKTMLPRTTAGSYAAFYSNTGGANVEVVIVPRSATYHTHGLHIARQLTPPGNEVMSIEPGNTHPVTVKVAPGESLYYWGDLFYIAVNE
ncbi:hypothetical protein M050_gp04 [Streptomyces phage Sujidade]|uniref:Uncharacterized protein n=1 Tax=Streptomyces phage Sujidade TaxID=1327759 RepID=R4TMV4_9CAUD|nr:hypothetical protein M050_gp04 [Streptomyces phage Sujidade]AGM12102.1 hypothetical protein SUJIDADE_4 [Streptomyces phage Sujidade]